MIEIKLDGIDEVLQQLNPRTYQKALNKTVNDMGLKMRTKLVKDVRKKYNISAAKLKQHMNIKRSRYDNMRYEMHISSKRRNVMNFAAKKLKKANGLTTKSGKADKRKDRISLKIKNAGGRQTLKHSFLAKNGAVLHRVGKTQEIKAVTTISIPQMFNDKMLKEAKEMAQKETGTKLKDNFAFYLGKA